MYQECRFYDPPGYEKDFGGFETALIDFYKHPTRYRIQPFRIFGNLYYVGNKQVCMHLVNTGNGLILFDSGYGHDFFMLLESIRELGFNPADIRIVIHSHGHFDHFNGGEALRNMYGSKIYMSRVDTDLLREKPQRALVEKGPFKYGEICWPDIELNDGDTITLGNTSVNCVLAPGHTLGTMAFFFDAVNQAGEMRRVGYWGGCGFLTVYRKYCEVMELPQNKLERMGESIKKLYKESVDITLGNHPAQNCTIEKREWMVEHPGDNPFVNSAAWRIFLDSLDNARCALMHSELY